MVSPQLEYAEVIGSTLTLSFDQELDTGVQIPEESFQINFGKIEIFGSEYRGQNQIVMDLSSEVGAKDIISLSYEPPSDAEEALRRPIPPDSSTLELRKAAVKAIYRFRVNNRTGVEGVNPDSNLGKKTNGVGYPHSGLSSDPRSATPGDFILAYGEKEAIELSNISESRESEPNYDRIWMAIQDAESLIDSYIVNSSKSCVRLVSSNRRRTTLIIARYYLDTVRRREDVLKDYELSIKELKSCDTGGPDRPGDSSAGDDARGVLRTHSVPQVYSRVGRLGLEGWWVNPASDEFPEEEREWH